MTKKPFLMKWWVVILLSYQQNQHYSVLTVFFISSVPCCPQSVTTQLVSTDTLEVTWFPVKGAEMYETRAAQANDVVQCNDTSPVCVLSDLRCNTVYSVTVTPCSELRGCNLTCPSSTPETGTVTHWATQLQHNFKHSEKLWGFRYAESFSVPRCSSLPSRDLEHDTNQQLYIQSLHHQPQHSQHKLYRHRRRTLRCADLPNYKQLVWSHTAALWFKLWSDDSGYKSGRTESAWIQSHFRNRYETVMGCR